MTLFLLENLREDTIALDLGCGIGGIILVVLRENPALKIKAIDLIQKNLIKDKKLISDNNLLEHCELTCEDAHCTSFPEQAFDYVWALESLMHMDQPVVLKEVFRILRNTGELRFLDYCLEDDLTEEESFVEKEELMSLLKKK